MPIIQVPFPLLEVSCHETCFPKYQRAGFLTLSEICRTIRLDVDFIPHEDDVYDELCLGVVIASAETYGHLENLDVTSCNPSVSTEGSWVGQEHKMLPDQQDFFIYKFYACGAAFRTLGDFAGDITTQWDDWVIFAGIKGSSEGVIPTSHARGTMKIIQSLSIPFERIFSDASDKRLYHEDDQRERKRRRAEYQEEFEKQEARKLDDLMTKIG